MAINAHGRMLHMNKLKTGLQLAVTLVVSVVLTACGGESIKTPVKTATPKSSSSFSVVHKDELDRSIAGIKANPLTRNFAVTASYPYVITGDLSAAELAHWKHRVQRTQSAIKSMYFAGEPAEVIQIWLFKNRASYYHYNRILWGASPSTPYGYYLPEKNRMMMNIASGGGTLTHELVHPYIEANFPQSPLWFNEGLASLYEQSYYRSGQVFGAVNWRLSALQAVINANAMPSLGTLMRTNRQQFLGPNREIYYAQARYLMLYLQSRKQLQHYYRQFVANVDTDKTGIQTLLAVTGQRSLEALEKDWISFVSRLSQ